MMLETIIKSKTRIKLLIKFFFIDNNRGYLRGMEKEFGETINAVRQEVNNFVDAGLLTSELEGNKRFYKANTKHPLYEGLKVIVRKTIGVEQIIENVTSRVGNLNAAYITGNFAQGVDADVIEMALVGEELDTDYIDKLIPKAEGLIGRKIMYLTMTDEKMKYFFKEKPTLLIWKSEK